MGGDFSTNAADGFRLNNLFHTSPLTFFSLSVWLLDPGHTLLRNGTFSHVVCGEKIPCQPYPILWFLGYVMLMDTLLRMSVFLNWDIWGCTAFGTVPAILQRS